MAYSVEADLNLSEQRKIELTESESALNVKDAALIAQLQLRATNKINAALFGEYITPVAAPFPAILTELEADLWRYYLYTHREVMEVPKSVEADYNDARKLLKAYARKDELLNAPQVNAPTGPTNSSGTFSSDSDDRLFGRAKDGISV